MKLISIIIPIYNVEKYVEKCINSVLQQTYPNLDIILVNDGSTDSSGLICDEFSKQDARITVVHKTNGGLSDARNKGANLARGEYIFYLDSDDYLSIDCILTLYNTANKFGADIVQSNYYYVYPQYLLYDNTMKDTVKVYKSDKAMNMLLEQTIIKNFAWGKLIRSDIAKQFSFIKGKYYEDTFWKFHIIDASSIYVILGKPMVYYLQREQSISGQFSLRNLDQLEGEFVRLNFLKENYPHLVDKALKEFKIKIAQHAQLVKQLNKKEEQIYLSKIDNYKKHCGLDQKKTCFLSLQNIYVVYKLNQVIKSLKNRLLNTNNWVKIEYEDSKRL